MSERYYYPNRTLCDVLHAMRKAHEVSNYSYLTGLIEEAQHIGDIMEAGLGDKQDIKQLREERHDLKAQVKMLRKKVKKLNDEVEKKTKKKGE